MAVGSGEDRSAVKRRGGGWQWEKPKKPLGRELELGGKEKLDSVVDQLLDGGLCGFWLRY